MFFFVFVFETPLKDFLFFSPILVTLWFRCLQIHIKESCMYLSTQNFSQTPHTFPNSKKNQGKKAFPSNLFPLLSTMGRTQGSTELSKESESLGKNRCRKVLG